MLIRFVIKLAFVDVVWQTIKGLVGGHTTSRIAELIVGAILASILQNRQQRKSVILIVGAYQKSKVTIEDLWSINFAYTMGRNGW